MSRRLAVFVVSCFCRAPTRDYLSAARAAQRRQHCRATAGRDVVGLGPARRRGDGRCSPRAPSRHCMAGRRRRAFRPSPARIRRTSRCQSMPAGLCRCRGALAWGPARAARGVAGLLLHVDGALRRRAAFYAGSRRLCRSHNKKLAATRRPSLSTDWRGQRRRRRRRARIPIRPQSDSI